MKIIVGNSRTEEMAGDLKTLNEDESERLIGAWGAQRVLWFAEDDDIMILPWRPPAEYLGYVTSITGTDPDTLTILVPPPGELGVDLLTPDRILDPALIEDVRGAVHNQTVHRVLTCYDDQTIVAFTEAAGVTHALRGYAFAAQGGVGLVNSKAAFRAIASGTGVPIAPGAVTSSLEHAVQVAGEIFRSGHPVMVKQEFNSGGFGNSILSPKEGITAAGAHEVKVLDVSDLAEHFSDSWDWMSGGGHKRVVIERYFADSVTVYAESDIQDERVVLSGIGQMLMTPVAAGEIVPPQDASQDALSTVAAGGQQVCELFRAIGYRGYLSADAIVTPLGEVFFTEANGRYTGSTHLHMVLKRRVLARRGHRERVLLESEGWHVPSYAGAVDALMSSGLGYRDAEGTGVIITANYVPVDGSVMYCVIARSYEQARSIEASLLELEL
jgi:hypothetical protein